VLSVNRYGALLPVVGKTAHSFAIAVLGDESFVPLLPQMIRRKFAKSEQWPDCYHLVGGIGGTDTPPSHALHELGLAFATIAEKWYLTTHIRLFGNLGAPTFVVVVGELKPGVTPEIVLARSATAKAALAQMSGKILDPHPQADPNPLHPTDQGAPS
jgi:hypothetical protein